MKKVGKKSMGIASKGNITAWRMHSLGVRSIRISYGWITAVVRFSEST